DESCWFERRKMVLQRRRPGDVDSGRHGYGDGCDRVVAFWISKFIPRRGLISEHASARYHLLEHLYFCLHRLRSRLDHGGGDQGSAEKYFAWLFDFRAQRPHGLYS